VRPSCKFPESPAGRFDRGALQHVITVDTSACDARGIEQVSPGSPVWRWKASTRWSLPHSERFAIPAGNQWSAGAAAAPLARPLAPRRLVGVISLGVQAAGRTKDGETAPQPFGKAVIALDPSRANRR
jgi:hypothetical protein